ncbi:malonate decarboxylase holo-ACP synthase [Peribacillus aracenensis]|uniref:malonate decarboxylase holo-ACP synthase n=1 Tax=Peribacillus aracenensis TaxID=2976708 RepID=UPI0021A6BEC3|nr:malonate decarboxylase holo-ACP synthase [Peribacillus sp. BBB004]
MELNPHDLLRIKGAEELISQTPPPNWVAESLAISPFVVIRRSHASKGQVAVGVRGPERNKRFAAFLPVDSILTRISPERLAQDKGWQNHSKKIFQCLDRVSDLLDQASLKWGPTGSVGFELATGQEVVTEKSDIDIVIRISEEFTINFAQKIENGLKKNPFRIDVQLETKVGAFSLSEYANSKGKAVLFRTMDGPFLKEVTL